ncbi:MAG: fructosamine kinase family protein, partial [Ottowia sp.]|nr:fructosamine kinase family protein [Ottowia sp.]
AADVLARLHQPRPAPAALQPLHERFGALFRRVTTPHDAAYALAADIAHELLDAPHTPVALHGDLHHENVVHGARGWLAIDPKACWATRPSMPRTGSTTRGAKTPCTAKPSASPRWRRCWPRRSAARPRTCCATPWPTAACRPLGLPKTATWPTNAARSPPCKPCTPRGVPAVFDIGRRQAWPSTNPISTCPARRSSTPSRAARATGSTSSA